jgi:alpha-glucosidase
VISPWPGDVPAGLDFAKFDLDYLRNGGLAGYATIGADLGGFYHGHTPDEENEIRRICDMLLVSPVIRTHGAYYKLPWMFANESQITYGKYLQLRYRLTPYIYSAAIEAHETGRPILAPLCFDHGDDPATYRRDFDFLLGRDLLVAPVVERAEQREVYLPRGTWRDFWTDTVYDGGRLATIPAPLRGARSLPMLVREGAILPMGPSALSIASELFQNYTFHLYPAKGQTSERLFKDRATVAGATSEINARVTEDRGEIVAEIEGAPSVETLYFHGVSKPGRVFVNGAAIPESAFESTSGWSYGKSDFPLQEGAVLKVRVGSSVRGKIVCRFR